MTFTCHLYKSRRTKTRQTNNKIWQNVKVLNSQLSFPMTLWILKKANSKIHALGRGVAIVYECECVFAAHVSIMYTLQICLIRTNLNPTGTRWFDVDITSIRRRPNFDEFPRNFRVLFRCNFDGRKIHVVFTYFFQCYFAGRKSTLFPRTFFDVISMVEKSALFPRTFFDVISFIEISTVFLLFLT